MFCTFLSTLSMGLHGSFGAESTKNFIKCFRPIPFSHDVGFLPHQSKSLEAFCQASILVHDGCGSIIELDDMAHSIHIFLVRQNRIKMCLWGVELEKDAKKEAFLRLIAWYAMSYPDFLLASDLVQEDAHAWDHLEN